ncbi:MAG: YceI family protein [Cryomorphaceae bacterium]
MNRILALTCFSFCFGWAAIGQVDTFKVDLASSSIAWTAKKVTGANNGSIDLQIGELWLREANLVGCRFQVDMASIKNEDLPKAYRPKLERHLKSVDFFDVEIFPLAYFVITGISPIRKGTFNYTIVGDLTIKGMSQEVSFPAKIKVKGNRLAAYGIVQVDRRKFDIRYGSSSFFDNLGDRAIDDHFDLEIKLGAKRHVD